MRTASRYGLAICSVSLVVCLKLAFPAYLGAAVPFLLFFGPILLTASYAGRGPAALATVLSAAAAGYFFLTPSFSFSLAGPGVVQLAVFLLEGAVITEMSSRWRTSEQAARLQRDLLRTTLLSIGDAVVTTDAAGRVVLMNPVAETLLGYGQEETEGKPLDDIFQIVDETSREQVPTPVRTVLAKGSGPGLAAHSLLISREGKEIPIDNSGAPIRGSDGVLEGAVLVFRDTSERRTAAREVEESARRLSSVLENIRDGFVILDADWRYVFLNEQAAKIRGRPREELLGTKYWQEPVQPASVQWHQEFQRAVRENVSVHFEEGSASGDPWYAVDAYPSPDGLSVFMRDVSGERRAAEELRISNERFRRLYEANLIGIVFWNTKTGVTEGNDEYFRLAGFTRKEFAERGGIRFGELTPPEHKEKESLILERMLVNGTSGLYEKEYLHRDGTRVPVLIGLALLDKSRQDGVSFALDISDRKMAERRFRQLADFAPVKVWIAAADGGLHFCNKRWLEFRGRTMEQEAGTGWTEGVHPDDLQGAMTTYLTALEARRKFRMEFRLRRHDGQWRWVLDDGQPIYSIAGEIEGYIGSCVDITERRQSEEQLQRTNAALQRSNEDLRQFAYAASHDLQEPLRMVSLYTQLLAKRYKGRLDTDADQFMDFATGGAKRMSELVQDLLAFTQVAEEQEAIDAPVASGAALERTLAGMRLALEGATVTHGELPMVAVHAQHLTQLFQNLIGNAVKYRGKEAPAIHVSAWRDERWWVYSVKDNGMGIDAQYHERIFGIFKRLHREEYPGTGIGLAICSRIVERYGGRIWVNSKAGEGAEFLFTLPGA